MNLDKKKLHTFFINRGITHLYHANTVGTALTYIGQNGLLSRGAVEQLELYQTHQRSDYKDRQLNIWHDVFLDTQDLHSYFGRENRYGPVLFRFSVDFLLRMKSEVRITKDNPIRWRTNTPSVEKYFRSVAQIEREWDNFKTERRMITIRNNSKPILFKYLDRVVLDEPFIILNNLNLFKVAGRQLRSAIKETNLGIKVTKRVCPRNCYCQENYYEKNDWDLKRLFFGQKLL